MQSKFKIFVILVKDFAQKTEKELIASAAMDLEAFGELYRRYFPKIYSYIYNLCQSHQLSEDIVSEAFERALMKIVEYEERGYTFGAWLYRISYNVFIDHTRKTKKVTQIANENVIELADNQGDSIAEDLILKEEIWQAINTLDESEKTMIIMRYIEGYSIKEVAYTLNKTEDAVKSSCKRSLAKIRKHMLSEK